MAKAQRFVPGTRFDENGDNLISLKLWGSFVACDTSDKTAWRYTTDNGVVYICERRGNYPVAFRKEEAF